MRNSRKSIASFAATGCHLLEPQANHLYIARMELLQRLGLALAIGLLIGAERGWQERAATEGERVAGVRTFGLLGLLGGFWALLAQELGTILLGFSFLAITLLMVVAHVLDVRADRDVGITTVIAALLTFVLGATAVQGHEAVAAGGAVITAVILSLKSFLHGWLKKLEETEIFAALKLLLMSVVILPWLPERGYGPWNALNPYDIWLFVVLVASISFAGYFAMKLAGTTRGILLTGLLGGIVSSTAVTLTFARLAGRENIRPLLCAGILLAAAVMFPRILLEVAVVNPGLLAALSLPLGVMTLVTLGAAVWFWRHHPGESANAEFPVRNPMELLPAFQFGLFLMLIFLLGQALMSWFGDAGIYALAAFSGLADVDAITLSVSRMAKDGLSQQTAVHAIVLASIVNSLTKGVLALVVAGRETGLKVLTPLIATAVLGAISIAWKLS